VLMVKRSRKNGTSAKRKGLEMMMVVIIHFSCLRS
jgi:hypothetical protein